jgi:hypothetical protein
MRITPGNPARWRDPRGASIKKSLLFWRKEAKDVYSCASAQMPAMASIVEAAQNVKVFWFLSLEKNCFPKSHVVPTRSYAMNQR